MDSNDKVATKNDVHEPSSVTLYLVLVPLSATKSLESLSISTDPPEPSLRLIDEDPDHSVVH